MLAGIEDVTPKSMPRPRPAMSTAKAGQAQRAAMSTIEQQCSTGGLRCDVITLVRGRMYHLYRYRKYTDVRLVFAPEFDIAFFGGDPDNFEFPRYDLDVTFFRVYENGQPAHIEHHLTWSKTGVKEGRPGVRVRTSRFYRPPLDARADAVSAGRAVSMAAELVQAADCGPEGFQPPVGRERTHRAGDIFGLENSQKAIGGFQSGLLDKNLMASKAAREKKLQQFVAPSRIIRRV